MEETVQLSKRAKVDLRINNKHSPRYTLNKIRVMNRATVCNLHCLRTKAILTLSVQDIVFNTTVLQGLSSQHSCFIGFEYAKILRPTLKNNSIHKNLLQNVFIKKTIQSKETYYLHCQTRDKLLGFIKKDCNVPATMDPIEMIQLPFLVEKFNSLDAFYIGLYAGLKLARISAH